MARVIFINQRKVYKIKNACRKSPRGYADSKKVFLKYKYVCRLVRRRKSATETKTVVKTLGKGESNRTTECRAVASGSAATLGFVLCFFLCRYVLSSLLRGVCLSAPRSGALVQDKHTPQCQKHYLDKK